MDAQEDTAKQDTSIGVVLNPNAGHFRTKKGEKELRRLVGQRKDKGYLQEKYGDRLVIGAKRKPEDIQYTCDEFLERRVRIIVSVGGDGTEANIHTNMARRAWENSEMKDLVDLAGDEDCPGMISFLKSINTQHGFSLPYFYNVKKGTVHVCSNLIGATSNLELALDNAFLAFDKGHGVESFRRVYLPTIIGHSAEEPNNPSRMEIMLLYADAGIRRFFDEYYKDKGPGKPDIKTAYWIIAKAIASLPVPNGFIYELGKKIPSNVTIDGKALPIEQRTALVASMIHGDLYYLKPFHLARKDFQDFERHYSAGESETRPDCPTQRKFHVLTGDFEPWRIIAAIPRVVMGKPSKIKGLYDLLANEVTIEQLNSVVYIADGTRKEEGRKLVLTSGFEIGVPYLHEAPLLR
jgi:hypothetical protein